MQLLKSCYNCIARPYLGGGWGIKRLLSLLPWLSELPREAAMKDTLHFHCWSLQTDLLFVLRVGRRK